MGILQKIAWKTRKWNLKICFLDIALHDNDGSWGIKLLDVQYKFRSYCLFCIDFRLPNGADIKKTAIDSFDLFFLRNYLWNVYDDISDRKLWGSSLSTVAKIKLVILERVFK